MVEMVQDFTKDEPGMIVPTAPPEYFSGCSVVSILKFQVKRLTRGTRYNAHMEKAPNYYVIGLASMLVLWTSILLLMRTAGI
ncbi:hypothetical protein [Phyllobacterium chamaecytisi]|uniref:hypothetical protein n=1 Tax=Phyllobacterium chamaecytisi TaxID=2876082 RepID=UPI001CC9263A|nr:hypothetical protein [Phyllobacterium sp. KW56]MBZ9605768.1 hypothetical protein [Phyllobacterium sp. KW56]